MKHAVGVALLVLLAGCEVQQSENPFACVDGEERCRAEGAQRCVDARWVPCADCVCADAGATCFEGAAICMNDGRGVCVGGEWMYAEACDFICIHGACVDRDSGATCADGTWRCAPEGREQCERGAWRLVESCAGACVDGACPGADAGPQPCAPDAFRCVPAGLERCVGGEWTLETPCAERCVDGACPPPECAPDTFRCHADGRLDCVDDFWVIGEICPGQCVDGACAAPDVGWPAPDPLTARQADPPVCGNSITERREACDFAAARSGIDCVVISPAYRAGVAVCDRHCHFDESACERHASVCGDGVVTVGEACDDGNRLDRDGCSRNCRREGEGGALNVYRTRHDLDSATYANACDVVEADDAPLELRVQLHVVRDGGVPAADAATQARLLADANAILAAAQVRLVTAGPTHTVEAPAFMNLEPGHIGLLTGVENSPRAVDVYLVNTVGDGCVFADAIGGAHIGDGVVVAAPCGGWALARGIAHLAGLWPLGPGSCAARGVCDVLGCADDDCGCVDGCAEACAGGAAPLNLMGASTCARGVQATLSADQIRRLRCHVRTDLVYASRAERPVDGMLLKAQGDPAVFLVRRGYRHHIADEPTFHALDLSFSDVVEMSPQAVDALPVGVPIGGAGSVVEVAAPPGYHLLREIENPDGVTARGWLALEGWPDVAIEQYIGAPLSAVAEVPAELLRTPPGGGRHPLPVACAGGYCYCGLLGFTPEGWHGTISPAYTRALQRIAGDRDGWCPYGQEGPRPLLQAVDGVVYQPVMERGPDRLHALVYGPRTQEAWFVSGAIGDAWWCAGPAAIGPPIEDAVDGRQRFESGTIVAGDAVTIFTDAPVAACPGVEVRPAVDDCPECIDACARVCAPGARRCGETGAERCTPDGCGWAVVEACGCCRDGRCGQFEERCNGRDDDCDGAVDEALVAACRTACGAGTQTCSQGGWTGCDARIPTPEQPNGFDDDCRQGPDDPFLQLIHRYTNACSGQIWMAPEACSPHPEEPLYQCDCPPEDWPAVGGQFCADEPTCWRSGPTYMAYRHGVEHMALRPLISCTDPGGAAHLWAWDEAQCAARGWQIDRPRDLGWFGYPAGCVPPSDVPMGVLYQCQIERDGEDAFLLTFHAAECQQGGVRGFVDPATLDLTPQVTPFAYGVAIGLVGVESPPACAD